MSAKYDKAARDVGRAMNKFLKPKRGRRRAKGGCAVVLLLGGVTLGTAAVLLLS